MATLSAQTTWHVDTDRPDGGGGLTWETALDGLHDALDVAQDTYKPDAVGAVRADPRALFADSRSDYRRSHAGDLVSWNECLGGLARGRLDGG